MDSESESLSPERLLEAAEAVMLALTEVADESTGRCPYPPDLLGSESQPDCLRGFTRYEVEEATQFLCRLGYLMCRRSHA